MPLYEVVREIENHCARNQMRDVFFDEIETDCPADAVRSILKDESNPTITEEKHADGSVTVYAECSGIIQRFLFTKI